MTDTHAMSFFGVNNA